MMQKHISEYLAPYLQKSLNIHVTKTKTDAFAGKEEANESHYWTSSLALYATLFDLVFFLLPKQQQQHQVGQQSQDIFGLFSEAGGS